MKIKLNKSLLAVAVGSLFTASIAQATNGYFSDGTGAKNRGMGGAGTALAQEAGSIVVNPAAAVNMDPRMDVSMGLFSPSGRGYTISGNDCSPITGVGGCTLDGTQESRKTGFLIPFYGQNFKIDSSSSWAVTVSALGGMNTDYKNNAFANFGASGAMGINLAQVSIGGTYAKQLTNDFSVGVTASLVMQQFEAKGLQPFQGLSLNPGAVTNTGKSMSNGIGFNFGATYELNNDVTIGFSYAPEVDMSEFDEYAGLFAEGGDFNIPSNYSLGVAWQASSNLLVSADYRKINYTDVASVSNDAQRLTDGTCDANPFLPTPVPGTAPACLGGAEGAGFGWSDMDVIKVGVAYKQSSDLTLRAGLNHAASPIESEDATINVIAPGVVESHVTLGMTKKLDSSSELSFAFIHALNNSVSGAAPAAFGGGTTTIEMEQNFLEVQYGVKF